MQRLHEIAAGSATAGKNPPLVHITSMYKKDKITERHQCRIPEKNKTKTDYTLDCTQRVLGRNGLGN